MEINVVLSGAMKLRGIRKVDPWPKLNLKRASWILQKPTCVVIAKQLGTPRIDVLVVSPVPWLPSLEPYPDIEIVFAWCAVVSRRKQTYRKRH